MERISPASKDDQRSPMNPRTSNVLAANRVTVGLPKDTRNQHLALLMCWKLKHVYEKQLGNKINLPTIFTTDSFLFLSAPVSKS